ncbi:MAG: hypothetical protein F4Y47_19685 [Acidobacteriia bacterium]|nr:hypothetical protein [Terriglobia bacterium]MYK10635.1 hypothetical protein [Terriglobia bacterium]
MNLLSLGAGSSMRRESEDRAKIAIAQAALVGATLPVVVMALRHHFRDRDDMLGRGSQRALGIRAARGSEASDDPPRVGRG